MKKLRKLQPSEHDEAVALMQAIEVWQGRYPVLGLLYAIPNGGDRHPVVAAKMKAEGVKAGVPDYCLPAARAGFHGLYIELKTATGRASREQAQWVQDLRAEGYRAEVCRGWEQALRVLLDYVRGPAETGTRQSRAAQNCPTRSEQPA
jgi:hypothetical protein